ncbi:MAG: hypothetical protein QOJ23_3073 [Actinomycetota bacterium]|jgi:hypothetical protein|nr:hypothetical protein [Actinomycetota bacterium]MDQ1569195.1 hypothetical protein [Actinomycetota bacterium]
MAGTTLELYTPEKQKEVLQLLGISGPSNHLQLLFQLGEKYQLDILTKEITLIPGKGPFIGVWGRLHIAHRSGKLDGLEMDDEWETDKHYCVRVIVWRKDMGRPAAKVIGRVGKHEGSKDKNGVWHAKEWPLEIARARGLRAGLGFAFSIHDSYDTDDEDANDWVAPPDERIDQNGAVVGTIIPAAPAQEEVTTTAQAAAAPKRTRRVNKKTGEVIDVPAGPPEHTPGAGEPAGTGETSASVTPSRPDPAPEPPTVVVGGHTLAQKIAMAAREAGIDDDQTRHDVISAASRGTYQRGSDIPEAGYDQDVVDRIFDAFAGLKTGAVDLRYEPDGTPKLFKVRR